MKKVLLSLLLVAPAVFASPQQELNTRLAKLNSFTAEFDQVVTSPEGEVISEGEGTLAMKRPNLFNWETVTPDENTLISDGKTLWYYSPFIEQVTAMWLDDATSQTPFVLLTRNDPKDWNNYDVAQNGNTFTLSPKKASSLGEFVVSVEPNGRITQFSVVEQDGQTSKFALENVKNVSPSSSLFSFTVPKGVELDDQRQ
ncbi:outer membrane lipoprotein chaperone LolA [Enterovibrio nigricans]|uniref:Outer-membrane lipoprotein carrier protein n=1 Tax=Enterovibrio nigricans DSM 22720 TaxID=1121868 RepID=A0A1T4U692_9GAMM|nr:outer membrane lipoprotein chaperone LolA [Enterovibrio nigricans]PKF51347.1 outer membrane lipoprotein chaperone LolA [Enterovibrio nigricans]SKA48041.1 outer membrane lipoprotein carrier protein [Enterovibrio nigricans DSM 22720]